MKKIQNKQLPGCSGYIRRALFLIVILLFGVSYSAYAWKCVYVSSYHKGYAWSDAIERALWKGLEGKCDITQFNMDTKRNKDEVFIRNKASEIATKIKKINPDILIVSDDNAAKYLVVPYFKGRKLPVIFSGINWTVDEYGFPASNVTGMVEVAPVRPMLEWVPKLMKQGKKGLYISANTLTERKFLKQVVKVAADMDMMIDSAMVETMDEWQESFEQATEADFIIIGSPSGIIDWDINKAKQIVSNSTGKLLLTNYDWMMPVAMLGFVEIPEEHGSWSARTAIAILEGLPIQRIPIIASQKWEVYENPELLRLSGIKISEVLRAKAKKFNQGVSSGSR